MWWHTAVTALAGLALVWLALVAAMWVVKPDDMRLRELMRLLPDVLRLLTRLARDKRVPLGARLGLWGLMAYLALPIDVIPDFIPVVGYVDDAIIVAVVLRFTVRRVGWEIVAEEWPGTAEGLRAIGQLFGIHHEV